MTSLSNTIIILRSRKKDNKLRENLYGAKETWIAEQQIETRVIPIPAFML